MATGKNKKSSWINEKWLGWKPMTTFAGLRAKTCSYLKNVVREDKKAKDKKGGS